MSDQANKLKLFVVGASRGNPDEWSEYARLALVMAETPEQATSLVDFSNLAAEVECAEPTVLISCGN